MYGGIGNDRLDGGEENDELYGGDGNDVLFGGKGQDFVFGGNGADTLYAGEDGDLVEGGAGNDSLYGEKGEDEMYGGLGDDAKPTLRGLALRSFGVASCASAGFWRIEPDKANVRSTDNQTDRVAVDNAHRNCGRGAADRPGRTRITDPGPRC